MKKSMDVSSIESTSPPIVEAGCNFARRNNSPTPSTSSPPSRNSRLPLELNVYESQSNECNELGGTSPTKDKPTVQCDILYSLPIDNIPNAICTNSMISTNPKLPPLDHHEFHTNTISRCKLANVSNNLNLSQPKVNMSGMDTKKTCNQITIKGPVLVENNNNIETSVSNEKIQDKTDQQIVPQNCFKKKFKKKRRRNILSKDRDCQQQVENEVPGKLQVEQTVSDPLTAKTEAETCEHLKLKPKRSIGDAIIKLFRKRRSRIPSKGKSSADDASSETEEKISQPQEAVMVSRALPPTPCKISDAEVVEQIHLHCEDLSEDTSTETCPVEPKDIAASIEKVKDCGWYWGPLSSEAAEDLLRGEQDGSFIVRDSSDSRYIFSLTFKLNGLVRHVRIEHDQGNFSFGATTRFKANTIIDFVEKAVAHSRSGRYLFFLHRRPVLGPMRVQLINPVSRFRRMRTLQHMCRFVILKNVRRDLVNTLPLPNPMLEYLNTPHYYFEE